MCPILHRFFPLKTRAWSAELSHRVVLLSVPGLSIEIHASMLKRWASPSWMSHTALQKQTLRTVLAYKVEFVYFHSQPFAKYFSVHLLVFTLSHLFCFTYRLIIELFCWLIINVYILYHNLVCIYNSYNYFFKTI